MLQEGRSQETPKPAAAPRCPRCSEVAASGQKFCGACGAPLPRRCERKHLTVLLSDVSGFTAMSERLDAEDVREILDRVFEIIIDTVHAHGGTVNQFLGDGVMALFDDTADRDHATRALRAALTIEARLEPVRADVLLEHGVGFRVRIGVHTGPVVMGMIGDGLRSDYVPQGDTTDVAALLIAAARPGEVLATQQTLEHAAQTFVSRSAGDIARATRERVGSYAVMGELPERVDAEAGLLVEM